MKILNFPRIYRYIFNFASFINLISIFRLQLIIKLIMMSSWFDLKNLKSLPFTVQWTVRVWKPCFHQPICETITILSRRLKQKIAYMKYFHKLKSLCPCGLLLSFFIMGHLKVKIEISNWSMGIWNFEYVPLLDSFGAHYVYDSIIATMDGRNVF